MDLPSVFDTRGRLRGLSEIEIANLGADDLQRYRDLESAYTENREVEDCADALRREAAEVSKQITAARIAANKAYPPLSHVDNAKAWILSQRLEHARRMGKA